MHVAARPFTFGLILALGAAGAPAWADDDPGYVPGPWHYRAMSCVDTTVREVAPRLTSGTDNHYTAADFASGVDVIFATGLGMQPLFSKGSAEVVHYQDSAGNDVMRAERAGDKVQVCFLGGPPPTKYCNPDTDSRGRQYRVWDYKQRKQFWGMNSEHDCGGA